MIPRFSSHQPNAAANLLCPGCQSTLLHHSTVEVFERDEDAAHGLHVTVGSGTSKVDNNLGGNPSSRRHGLIVNFWCEACHAISALSIGQHKGETEVDFQVTGKLRSVDP